MPATNLRAARLEEARRELQRRAVSRARQTPFQDWLGEVTPAYTWDWDHLVFIQQQLARVRSGDITKLMLFVPPRHGTSEMTTIRYPVYRMEMNPKLRVILGCYNQDLANKFSRDARKIARRRGIVGGGVCKQDEWEIKGGGSYRAAGVGGGVTGRGADLLIIDDPVRSRDDANSVAFRERVWDWYTNDMRTRLEPGGAIILIQTRWHEDDLAGRILKSADGPNWTVVSLLAEAEEEDPLGREVGAALCPERFDIAALADLKSVLGLDYYALYQQRPVAQEGGLYKRNWFTYCDPQETPAEFDYIVQAWDTASSRLGDYSVCATVGVAENSAYILDVFRARLETPDLLLAVQDQYAAYFPRSVYVEDASNGTSVIQMLKRETRLPILAVAPHKGGKVSHANANLPYVEGGRVIFVRGAYLADFERELLAFPNGSHDDQVDALNIALTRIFGRLSQRASSHDGSGRNAALEKAGIHVAGEQPWTPPEPKPEPKPVKSTPFRRPPSKPRPITQAK